MDGSETTKKQTLTTQFAYIFIVFGVISVMIFGFIAYRNEYTIHRNMRLDEVKKINNHLKSQILSDGRDFAIYAKLINEYSDEIYMPMDKSTWEDLYADFLKAFSERYSGQIFGSDIGIEGLEEDVLIKYLEYDYAYWMLTFESALKEFGLKYLYLIVPNDDGTVSYIVDVWRSERADAPGRMEIYYVDPPEENPREEVPILWQTWETGRELNKFQKWNNENGHTYSYYTPLIIDGEKIGLIVGEIEFDLVNHAAFLNALFLGLMVTLVYILCGVFIFMTIKNRYVNNVTKLNNEVHEFSITKDYSIADRMDPERCTSFEMASLTAQVAEMIRDLKKYMDDYAQAQSLFTDSKAREVVVNQLAMKDSLTGSYNKTAYDSMCEGIDNLIAGGNTEFGIAMIDLNYLKKINDTYGHPMGNAALINLYEMICDIYPPENVYRIGGDEFVVMLVGECYDNAKKDAEEFSKKIAVTSSDESLKPWRRTSAAIGIALFDASTDKCIADTFRRADEIMYENKKAMKAVREA